MSGNAGTLERIALEVGQALQPLEQRLASANVIPLFAELGLQFPPQLLQGSVVTTVNAAATAAGQLSATITQLSSDIEAGNTAGILQQGLKLTQQIASVITALENLRPAIIGVSGGLGMNAVEVTDFAQKLPSRLLGYALITRLESLQPGVAAIGGLLGLFDYVEKPGIPGDPTHPRFISRDLQLSRLGDILSSPANVLRTQTGWGDPGFDGTLLVPKLNIALGLLGVPSQVVSTGPTDALGSAVLSIRADPTSSPPGLLATLKYPFPSGIDLTLPLSDTSSVRLRAQGAFDAGLEATITAPLKLSVKPVSGTLAGLLDAEIGLNGSDSTHPIILIGQTGASRVQADSLTFGLGLALEWDAGANAARTEPTVRFEVRHGKVVIDTSSGDGFLATILGGFSLESDFELGFDYSVADGLRFRGSGTLEVQLARHITLGPVTIDNLNLALGIRNSSFPLSVRADLGTSLGPLTAVVHGIGFELLVSVAANNHGNVGPFDIQPRFVAPTGVGLALNAGGFRGGGFLKIDTEKGEYAGGLELDFIGIVTVKAFGLINTKFPDGHRGFSLVIIISAEFPPIQLGFGFTLVGVGGLLGVNRTVDTDAVRDGLHQGALDSVLFPTNIVANAPRIVNDLRRLFPPLEGHFLVGPMVKFGWGTPTILSLEFGLILDVPRPAFVIIGRLRLGLPFQDLPLFDVRVTFAGGVDFEAGQLWFDATLHDSRLLCFALTGDMAVRVYWKENANFILTVGGFHPAYTPPPMGLGTLQRLGITIFDGNPRLRAETYFAITSNTVQWGTKAELFFGIDAFNVYGFIAYDVLIQFDPFRFIATLSAMLAVRSGSAVLLGIRVDALLEGPSPWHAKGTGHFEISFIISITIDVDFEVTLGEKRNDALPPLELLPKLAAAFGDDRIWRAVIPAGTNLQVTLRKLADDETALVLHPFGSLEIAQKLAPLDLPITKVGTQKISDGRVFRVQEVKLGDATAQVEAVREQFAPAEFTDMSDAQKLASRSFESYDGGIRAGGGDAVNADYFSRLELSYEVIYIPEHKAPVRFGVTKFLFDALAGVGAVGQSALSATQNAPSPLGTPGVSQAAEQFAVASTTDLSLHHASLVFASEGEARAAMTGLVERDPTLIDAIQVIPWSLARAA